MSEIDYSVLAKAMLKRIAKESFGENWWKYPISTEKEIARLIESGVAIGDIESLLSIFITEVKSLYGD
jgi:hypothetical protein